MKLKMSENSLFAILLRKPWWVSALIVAVGALAARALLPEKYVVVGVLGTFPFVVTLLFAARRQWRTPSEARQQAALTRAASLSWPEFADWLVQVYQQQGYGVTRLEGEAADLCLVRQGQSSLVSCRRWKAATHGVQALRELQATRRAQDATQAVYLSLGPVSAAAQSYARDNGIELLQGEALALMLAQTKA